MVILSDLPIGVHCLGWFRKLTPVLNEMGTSEKVMPITTREPLPSETLGGDVGRKLLDHTEPEKKGLFEETA